MGLLSTIWYTESPIDFEHKQYLLFAYLQNVDNEFNNKKLSPHLLHLEEMIDELYNFKASFEKFYGELHKNQYIFFDNKKLEGLQFEDLFEIKNIVDFSIPQINPRINLGYQILKRNNQILY